MTQGEHQARTPGGAKAALAGLLGTVLIGPPAATLAALSGPLADGPAFVVAAPWSDLSRIVRAAGGRLVGPAAASFAALASGASPDFASRLAASGAWLVLDGRRIAQLCGAQP